MLTGRGVKGMKKSLFAGALFVTALSLSSFVIAAGDGQSGVIHFRGEIVEGACSVGRDNPLHASVSCLRDGTSRTQTVALNSRGSTPLMQDLGTVERHSVNGKSNLQLLVVTYR